MGLKALSVFLGTICAPVIPGIMFVVGTPINTDHVHWAKLILSWLGLFMVGYMFTFMFVLIIGLPLFLFAERRGWASWWTALLASGALSFLFALALRAPGPPQPRDFFVSFAYGAAASLTFWFAFKVSHSFLLSRMNEST